MFFFKDNVSSLLISVPVDLLDLPVAVCVVVFAVAVDKACIVIVAAIVFVVVVCPVVVFAVVNDNDERCTACDELTMNSVAVAIKVFVVEVGAFDVTDDA